MPVRQQFTLARSSDASDFAWSAAGRSAIYYAWSAAGDQVMILFNRYTFASPVWH